MTERSLPPSVRPERRTPTWTAESVPPALLGEHHTTVWAELVVEAGTVEFREEDGWTATASAGERLVIVPECRHRIAPSADARFHVQFYAPAG